MKILILKTNFTYRALGKLNEKYKSISTWKIRPERLKDVDYAFLLSKKNMILGIGEIDNEILYFRKTNETIIPIDFYYTDNIKERIKEEFLHNYLDYQTHNPATIKTIEELRKIKVGNRRKDNLIKDDVDKSDTTIFFRNLLGY